jgi:hypothetical protein
MTGRFAARHVSHKGSITVHADRARTLDLFTPEGEREWVPGWSPEYLFRAGGGDEIDTVFRTAHGDEETLWIVLDHDRDEGTASYARITPGSRLGTVTVAVEPIDETSCWVEICYELTGLSPEGNAVLARFDARAFRAMLAEWEERIGRVLGVPAAR